MATSHLNPATSLIQSLSTPAAVKFNQSPCGAIRGQAWRVNCQWWFSPQCCGYCRSGERMAFGHLVSRRYAGERIELEVLRKGRLRKVTVRVDAHQPLMRLHDDGNDPSYLVVAGVPLVAPGPLTPPSSFITTQTPPIPVHSHFINPFSPTCTCACNIFAAHANFKSF